MELKPPRFFTLTMTCLLRSSQRLAREVWALYPKSEALRYQLDLCSGPAPTPLLAMERMRHAARLLAPKDLIRVLERLAAERGRHAAEARRVEENILKLVDNRGEWLWYTEDRKDQYGPKRTSARRAS